VGRSAKSSAVGLTGEEPEARELRELRRDSKLLRSFSSLARTADKLARLRRSEIGAAAEIEAAAAAARDE
jgi:hypothetical protein